MRIVGGLVHNDREVLDEYGGFNEALQRGAYLERLPEARVKASVSIDDYGTWRATRFAGPEAALWGSE